MVLGRGGRELYVCGLVQGVGFRPFVYRLAHELELTGWVRNESGGVRIRLSGDPRHLEIFEERLQNELPPLARIDALQSHARPAGAEADFVILDSDASQSKSAPVSPDISLCDACRAEMNDPANRRYRYPFINCTDCGPRYTIIQTVPYDRPHTSMVKFAMCDACRAEYEDPAGRRYHAQPIACPACGPRLSLRVRVGREDSKERGFQEQAQRDAFALIGICADRIEAGEIIAVKGLGGFHLMCDAGNEEAVAELRRRKRRPAKPFAVMVKDLTTARKLCEISGEEARLLCSKERPIVLLKKRGGRAGDAAALSEAVAPGIDRLGLMLPYTPLHELLFECIDRPLVATSANLSDEPIIRDGMELEEKLGPVVDAILDHDREIVNACDDSVVQVIGAGSWVQWIRVARGVAPMTLPLDRPHGEETAEKNTERILATGAQQKSSIALALDDRVILSPHIGDLGSVGSMEYFERTVETFRRFYDFEPGRIVHDLHPGYATTKWAEGVKRSNSAIRIEGVQHHYAHALAAMAEYAERGPCLAFVWDGTGYGPDGTVWGGEVFIADTQGFERVGHLRPFRLLGGEKAVREPRRSALALLFELYTLEEVLALENPAVRAFSSGEIRLLHQAWRRQLHAPLTSSMGRLFDAVASLADVVQEVSYEGEAGLRLEAIASREDSKRPLLALRRDEKRMIIDWEPLIRHLARGESVSARGLIPALAELIVTISDRYPTLPVILSGGVFQNRTLCEAVLPRLAHRRLLLPRRTPVNDGALALGQLWYGLQKK